MKSIGSDLARSLAEHTVDLSKCFKITLKNGDTLGFTEGPKDIRLDDLLYRSCCGFEEDRQTSFSDMTSGNCNLIAIIDNVNVDRREVLSGKFDGAAVDIFMVNREHLDYGKITIIGGFVDSIGIEGEKIRFDIVGVLSVLEKTMGDIYSPLCRAEFCDHRCSLDAQNYTFSGTIASLTSEIEFHTSSESVLEKEDDYFKYGLVRFIDGPSASSSMEIKQSHEGNIVLNTSLANGMELGNQFTLVAGCDKKFSSCIEKFQNAINFRGEPNLPRTTKVYKFY
ncbi:MAG: DUF2163 domain-containing protein [Rickettsiales bacterium]|jgi:uncharacterized phage protein (TIGR02218 family)|nr:DUF2163 domain-containing protein [Rickettsiales bacterium]